MATHSSILAWKIPWTEETGSRKESMESQSQTQLATNTFRAWLRLLFPYFQNKDPDWYTCEVSPISNNLEWWYKDDLVFATCLILETFWQSLWLTSQGYSKTGHSIFIFICTLYKYHYCSSHLILVEHVLYAKYSSCISSLILKATSKC